MLTQEQIEDLAVLYASDWSGYLTEDNVLTWIMTSDFEMYKLATTIQLMEIARLSLKIIQRFAADYKAEDFKSINKQYLKL